METPSTNLGKDGREEENAELYATESLESSQDTIVPQRCRRNIVTGKTLILNIRRSRASATCRELFLQNVHGSRNSIPKHIISFDEKYVIRCLELIRNFAVRAAAWNFTSKVDILPDHSSSLAYIESRSSSNMAIEYPLGGGTEVVVNSTGDWAIGSVSGSQTMINILKSPLLQQFGSLDQNANFVKTNLLGVREPFYSDFAGSVKAAPNLEKEVKVLDHRYASVPLHRRDASMSSTSSSFSDHSSSSGYGTSFQGMLQCTWKDGLPHHVFTVDDKREVYVADLSKVESSDAKGVDYFYTFHSRRNGKKECDIHDLDLQSIAKMRVSTSIRFSSNNSEVRETQFVLSINSDNCTGEIQTSNHAHMKKRLTKKVVDVFRPSHSYKQRSSSKLVGSGAIFEDTPLDPSEGVHDNFLDVGESCAEYKHSPNLELAAIVVKDIYHHDKEAEVGGWGLKFLKKSGNKPSPDTTIPSERSRNTGECSTSTDIIIPAGFHGGPRTKVGGPSSLVERWISGGHCDCGGWDVGCPLTILNTRSGSTDFSSRVDDFGECKSIDLFIQGSKQNLPMLKMVNIHRGLYYIHFQSTLSTLQCFAIAAAMIHSRSPLFRSKVYRT
ncbi:hypothetical protein C2S51_013761 [Perilla frutescens var. frutescens]|nr:hypothetical protein C2S51_013761 [Perilla frutescens var. frutescens]